MPNGYVQNKKIQVPNPPSSRVSLISSRNFPQPAPPTPQLIPPTPQPVPPTPREGNTAMTMYAAKEDLTNKFRRVLATAQDWDSGFRTNKSKLTNWSTLD
ncbi:hypothetical protein AVEN_123049-1 [Araneus ventricosus]|uniref:Uncharacterized protein n=1 Tax=Araneus ventricosus TaxID=182803 RepID=A0A4Y2MI17_ARAVE|nr:hypothetical protein AVEN_123049-1 [Araneus ventricosus]